MTIPGIPGMVVGRTERIAVGVTNSYGDAQDLYVETVDPANPANYLEGQKSIPFEVIRETLRIRDGKAPGGFREENITIRLTRRGPVVTDLLPGLKSPPGDHRPLVALRDDGALPRPGPDSDGEVRGRPAQRRSGRSRRSC